VVLTLLNPGKTGENTSVVQENENVVRDVEEKTRSRELSHSNQFFPFFMQNKLRLFKLDLARHISFSTVSMHYHDCMGKSLLFKARNIEWPSSEMVDKSMSRSFKMKYPSTRTVIDCTELKVNMLSLLLLKSQTYSNCSVQIH